MNQTPVLHYADAFPYLLIGWEQVPVAGICLTAEQTAICPTRLFCADR